MFMDHWMPGTANNNNREQSNVTNEKIVLLLTRRMLHCSGVYPLSENSEHVPHGWKMKYALCQVSSKDDSTQELEDPADSLTSGVV